LILTRTLPDLGCSIDEIPDFLSLLSADTDEDTDSMEPPASEFGSDAVDSSMVAFDPFALFAMR
jgi:hypothetical protein